MSKKKSAADPAADPAAEPLEPLEPVVEAARMDDELPLEEKAEEPMDKDAMIAELQAKVEELTAQLEAMRAEAEARAEDMPDEEELAAAEATKREAAAVEAVDAAIARGNVSPVARDKWLTVARASGGAAVAELTKNLRAFPARQAKPAEALKGSLRMLDKTDPYVVALRGAKIPETEIERLMAARTKEN